MPYIAFPHLTMTAYDSSDDPICESDESRSEVEDRTTDESSGETGDKDVAFPVVPDPPSNDEDVEVVGALIPCPPPPPQRSSSVDDDDVGDDDDVDDDDNLTLETAVTFEDDAFVSVLLSGWNSSP